MYNTENKAISFTSKKTNRIDKTHKIKRREEESAKITNIRTKKKKHQYRNYRYEVIIIWIIFPKKIENSDKIDSLRKL